MAGTPPVSDHDPAGVAREVADTGSYQVINAYGNLIGGIMTDQAIGTVSAGNILGGFFVANADETNDDGTIDLIDTPGDLGTVLGGGPAIITGPGGDVRYVHVGGQVYRDKYFGVGGPVDEINFQAGESVYINDNSGAQVTISPGPAVAGVAAPATAIARLRLYGIRGSGGSAIVNIEAEGSLTLRGTSQGGAAAEIGSILLDGPGTPLTAGASGLTMAANGPPLFLSVGGTAPVDILDLQGSHFTNITNNTPNGEIVNITASSIGYVSSYNIGVATAQATPAAVIPMAARIYQGNNPDGSPMEHVYPFDQQRTAVVTGDLLLARASGSIGNIDVDPAMAGQLGWGGGGGTIQQIVANADGKAAPGVFEGITAPIVASGNINNVAIGMGITNSGNGNLAASGIFAGGQIGYITGTNADIRGSIVSLATATAGAAGAAQYAINRIQLHNGSIINANIQAWGGGTFDDSREFYGGFPPAIGTGPITNPPLGINSIFVDGTPNRPASNGGIIGAQIAAPNIGTIRASNSFGIINSTIQIYRTNGVLQTLQADGYGLRDVDIIAGASVGKVIVTGNGKNLPANQWESSVRTSEKVGINGFNPATGFWPNRGTDIHMYLQTGPDSPTNAMTIDGNLPATQYLTGTGGVTKSGVIAGCTIRANYNTDLIQAWRIEWSNRTSVNPNRPDYFDAGRYTPNKAYMCSDFDVANRIKQLITTEDTRDMQITTGSIWQMNIGRDSYSANITVAGIFSSLRIGRDYIGVTPDDVIQAVGANGEISSIFINRNMGGVIKAKRKIGTVTVRGKWLPNGAIYQNNKKIYP